MISQIPEHDYQLPTAVARIAAGQPSRTVWRNELGGLTFELGSGSDRSFVKWTPAGSGLDLNAERQRLDWAGSWHSVPRVLDSGSDAEGAWLVTSPLDGVTAVDPRWVAEPERAVQAIGRGLRMLHDRLPVESCPFSWSIERRLAAIGETTEIRTPPPIDQLVVCHGDACAPNTIVADDGSVAGHVDFDTLGVADRWADLAVATMSLEWNYRTGLEPILLDAYGIDPDVGRTDYYRWLWNLGD